MKASDLFVRCLEAEGVREIYGVPGEENADFMISLEDSPIEFVLCRHEQGAAFMAEVAGRTVPVEIESTATLAYTLAESPWWWRNEVGVPRPGSADPVL